MVGSTNATNSANHNKTKTGDSNFHQTFTGRPDSLVVWVNYNGGSGEEARISATIHDNYNYIDPSAADPNAPSHVVGKAVYNYPNTNGWERISIPFDYNHPATSAEYILITFTTNKTPGEGSGNDVINDHVAYRTFNIEKGSNSFKYLSISKVIRFISSSRTKICRKFT